MTKHISWTDQDEEDYKKQYINLEMFLKRGQVNDKTTPRTT